MSRPVFSFRPNLKNPEHERAWQLLMDVPAGQRNQYLVEVILKQEERGTLKRLIQEASDEETAVILLDFITGPGVAQDPVGPVADVIRNMNGRRHITYIANICGSAQDPQNVKEAERILQEAGVIVTPCSYESARLAGALMKALKERRMQ